MDTNDQVQRRVLDHLKAVMRLKGEVTVSVAGSIVALGGWLPSPAKRWAVVESVRRLPGVTLVRNGIALPPFSAGVCRAGDQARDLVASVHRPPPWAAATDTPGR